MIHFDIEEKINEQIKDIDNYNHLLGRSLMQPYKPANSGSRALMNSIHVEHFLNLKYAEVPIVQTGHETEFGEVSSSFIESNHNYRVIAKIDKYSFRPNYHYFIIVQDIDTGVYDVLERVIYKDNTESYGYLWNNDYLDSLRINQVIPKDQIIKTSIGYDEYKNKMNGVNLLTMYLSSARNMEDSIIMSESARKKMISNLVDSTDIPINDNDILKNIYGDENIYKSFPDIGEQIQNGIFCSIRRIENSTMLYTLSQSRLRENMISDKNIIMNGTVADIDVYCNNIEALGDSYYNQQLYFYYKEKLRFSKEINDLLAPIAINGTMTRRLQTLYSISRDIVAGKQFYKNNVFNNVEMKITVISDLEMNPGDKMADRYGGKGVVSIVLPDELMPRLDNGKIVEVIKNQSTCINRENIGQLHEQSITFIGMRLIDYFKIGALTPTECCLMWYKFISMIEPKLANEAMTSIDFYDETQARMFIDSLFEDDAIIISDEPYTTVVNIDTIEKIYDEFPFIKPYNVMIPMRDSNGNIRYINSRRPMVVGKIYNYRLKQYAEEKFSVTSLAATNLKNLNTRSKANKMYEAKYTKTPIMFGPMESGDMAHMGMQYVVMNLMLYASSPQARKLFEQLLIGDPYNIDIKLDDESKNRNAEIINALIKTMGLKIVFEKVPKIKKIMCTRTMINVVPNSEFKPRTNIREIMDYHDDELKLKYNAALMEDPEKNPMVKKVMCKIVDKNKGK